MKKQDISRRRFLQQSSLAAMGGVLIEHTPLISEIRSVPAPRVRRPDEPIIPCGLIGYGQWGREIGVELEKTGRARVAAVADNFDLMLTRASREIPDAERFGDCRAILDNAEIPAVLVATPTHNHRQIVLDALSAGKHVYCEAPLASTIDDARAIASAAKAASSQIFQCGLLFRSHPQYRSLFGFIRSGAIGRAAMVRSQWRKKVSWRRASATEERERELNWRLDPSLSIGLAGEIGIQQIDAASWFLNGLPVSSIGFGSIALWDDGREVPDTMHAVIEYPGGVRMVYGATLASSFDAMVDEFVGSDSTIMIRDQNAWMFKEVDAPLLGWEVYARKDRFYKETGVALVADATKLAAQGIDPTQVDPYPESALHYALQDFLDNNIIGPYEPSASYRTGFEATVAAIRVNESVTTGRSVVLQASEFEI
ncbi:MAG TPA: Gfo/Idh/MocA family oxidoreductase [Rhodothermales bacterium]